MIRYRENDFSDIRARWQRVNGDPLEYLIGRGRFGDEFVKLEDGTCVCRPVSEQHLEGK